MTETALSRAAAQQRADEIRVFRNELARLEAAEVLRLSPEQRRAVDHCHEGLLGELSDLFDIDRDSRAKQLTLGMRIVSFLGALALAASVFFLFYRFWGHFDEATQVAILIGSALAGFLLTIAVRQRDASGYFAKLAALAAFACFVLNMTMLGQIFNIAPTDTVLLPWAALAFLLAYVCDLRLLLAAGICCIAAYVQARVGAWQGVYWLHTGERPENFFPVAVLLFCFPLLGDHRRYPDFAPLYRIFGLLCLFLPMLVLSHWAHGSYLDLDPDLIEGGYQVAGFIASALAIGFGIRRGWGETVSAGIVFFTLFLYAKFYQWWWATMPKYLFFLIVGLTALLILVTLKRLRPRLGALERAP